MAAKRCHLAHKEKNRNRIRLAPHTNEGDGASLRYQAWVNSRAARVDQVLNAVYCERRKVPLEGANSAGLAGGAPGAE